MSNTYRFGKLLLSAVFKTFFRRTVFGVENFTEGAAIIASNHVSFLDPPVVGSAAPYAIYYLSRESLLHNLFARWLLNRLNVIPIKRGVPDTRSIRSVLNNLQLGRKVLMFPEGTRSTDGKLQKAKRGVGYVICKARVPVIPAYTHGTFEALPRHRAIIHFSKIVVSFGEPMYFDDIWSGSPSKEEYDMIGERIMGRIAELRDQILRRDGG